MIKSDKALLLEELTDKFGEAKFFYLTDFSAMTAEETNDFRRKCFEHKIEMRVVKNKLIKVSLNRINPDNYQSLYPYLKGHTAVLFSEDGKAPALMLKEHKKKSEKPSLKAAYIDQDVIGGADQLDFLTKMKSKGDLLGELLGLLNSPASNLVAAIEGSGQTLVGALNYGGATILGLLKSIEEKE